MNASPIPGKVTQPSLPEVFPRHRLFSWFDKARKRRLIWLVSPPGAGKTTVVADYLKRRNLSALWYQVDAGDADIATFFHYLSLAITQGAQTKKPALPRFTPDCLPGLESFTRRYFAAAFAALPTPFVMVLDNYQEIGADALMHQVIRDCIDLLPAECHVIVASRNEPPPMLARLRVNNLMAILEWNDLRLTLDEAEGLASQQGKAPLSDKVLEWLYQKTQGWVAGLVLMLAQLGARSSQKIPTGDTPTVLFDYFAGEIFENTNERTQRVLLYSAFLPRMTSEMVVELTGDAGAGNILAEFNQKNYFTENHARGQPIYQYHPLMREFLMTRANSLLPSDELGRVRVRAAEILGQVGEYEDAIALFSQEGEIESTVRLILNQARFMVAQGRSATLDGWISALPKECVDRTPWLLYWLGICRFPFNPPEGRGYFERAFARFKARNDLAGIYLSWSGVVEAIVHGYTELTLLDRWITTLEGLIYEHPKFPSPEIEARVSCCMFLALVFRQLHHPRIAEWMSRATSLSLECSEPTLKIYTLGYSVLFHLWTGDVAQAGATLERLWKSIQPEMTSPLIHIGGYIIASVYQLYRTTGEADLSPVNGGLKVASATGVHIWDAVLLGEGAGIALSAGDLDQAKELLQKMNAVLDEARRMDVCLYHYFTAWLAFCHGDLPTATTHAENSLAISVEAGSVNLEERSHVLLAQAIHEQGRIIEAWDHCAQARRLEQRRADSLTECMCLLTEAWFHTREQQPDRALDSLRLAMTLASRHGYRNFYGWRPEVMGRLCALALLHDIETVYVQVLIRERRLEPVEEAFDCMDWPWPIKIYCLGRFSMVSEGANSSFSGKTQQKPLELLYALIAFGGRNVPEEKMMEALWPETEGDAAMRALHTTLHRLRKLLGHDNSVILQGHKLTLDRQCCWVDVWAFERVAGQLEACIKCPGETSSASPARMDELLGRTFALYQGMFLKESEMPWCLSLRERLHAKFLRAMHLVGEAWTEGKEWARLVEVFQRAVDIDDLNEECYQWLMLGHRELGQHAEALAAYRRCHRLLQANLGIIPSAKTEAIRQSLQNP